MRFEPDRRGQHGVMRIALVLALIPVLLGAAPAGEKAAATYFTEDSVGDVRLGQLGLQRAHSTAVRELARTWSTTIR